MQTLAQRIMKLVYIVPDFPTPGVMFNDLTPVLLDGRVFRDIIDYLAGCFEDYDYVAGLDARGFLFASAIAYSKKIGLLAIRKSGKLPPPVICEDYTLEYGHAGLEIPDHLDALVGKRILIVDDVLATGGSARAAKNLLERSNAIVIGLAVIMEIDMLAGRGIFDAPVESIISV